MTPDDRKVCPGCRHDLRLARFTSTKKIAAGDVPERCRDCRSGRRRAKKRRLAAAFQARIFFTMAGIDATAEVMGDKIVVRGHDVDGDSVVEVLRKPKPGETVTTRTAFRDLA